MGHANGFWRKNWECTVSPPNLCPWSWQLTKSSSTSKSALNFVSSPPMMKPSCPGHHWWWQLCLRLRPWDKVTILPVEKPHDTKTKKRPDRWKAMSRAWSALSLTSRGLCTKNLSQQPKMWIPGSTATFCGYCVKTCEDVAPNFGENGPGCFSMTTPLLHFRLHPPVSGQKQNGCHPPSTILPWFGTL